MSCGWTVSAIRAGLADCGMNCRERRRSIRAFRSRSRRSRRRVAADQTSSAACLATRTPRGKVSAKLRIGWVRRHAVLCSMARARFSRALFPAARVATVYSSTAARRAARRWAACSTASARCSRSRSVSARAAARRARSAAGGSATPRKPFGSGTVSPTDSQTGRGSRRFRGRAGVSFSLDASVGCSTESPWLGATNIDCSCLLHGAAGIVSAAKSRAAFGAEAG